MFADPALCQVTLKRDRQGQSPAAPLAWLGASAQL